MRKVPMKSWVTEIVDLGVTRSGPQSLRLMGCQSLFLVPEQMLTVCKSPSVHKID